MFNTLRPGIFSVATIGTMLFLTAFRNMRRRLGFTIINVLGLAMGIASCLLIFLVVRYELGYDAFNKKADRIYRVNHHSIDYNPRVTPAMGPAMRAYFPELTVAQLFYIDAQVKVGNDRFNEKNFPFADEWVPRVFDYQWISGDPNTALSAPRSIVLTESYARKYFGNKDAMGQTVTIDNRWDCKVTGVIKDLPGNTSLPFPFMVSMLTVEKELHGSHEYWNIPDGSFTYFALPENVSIASIRGRIHDFLDKTWGGDVSKTATLILQPLRDVHFDQQYLYITVSPTTSRQTYWALAGIALFIIVTACINFINLATGQSATRAREVGVRKVLGARRSELIGQFLGEAGLQVVLASILGLLAAALLTPRLAAWLGIGISARELTEPVVLAVLVGLTLVVIPLAGLYPAFVQSAFRPILTLKGSAPNSRGGLALRRGLVVLQFGISQLMIIGTIVVARQMDYFQNRDLGFNKDFVISFDIPDTAHRQLLWQQLSSLTGVSAISFNSGSPANLTGATGYDAPQYGLTGENVTEFKSVDEHFIRMFGLTMLAGDTIMKRSAQDSVLPIVVNETLVNSLNIKDPHAALDKMIRFDGISGRIIGVVHDFQSESKHKKRRACIIDYDSRRFWNACVRLDPHDMHGTIDRIGKLWSTLWPKEFFQYEFLDEHIASFYRQEEQVYTAFRMFSLIAIGIGCLGLYGLIAFATLQRTREVGIRKVLGASVPGIVLLFSREFIWLIALAFVISAPIAWLAMHSWLMNFAYRIDIGWVTFAVAIGVSFLIAALTIAQKTVQAAVASPVRSLRTE